MTAPDPKQIRYTPAVSGDWNPAPTTLQAAEDQLAGRDGFLLWGNNALGSTLTTRFLSPGYSPTLAATTTIEWEVTRACKLRNMRIRCRLAGIGGGTVTYTLLVNGVASTLLVAILNTATTGQDTTHVVTLAAGDRISLQVTKSGTITQAQTDVMCTIAEAA